MKTKQTRSKPQLSGISFQKLVKSNWPLFKIYLLFGVTLAALFIVTMQKPVYFKIILPFNEFLAYSSACLLRLFGSEGVVTWGTSISNPEFNVNIAEGCNGIYALAIVIAGIVAFPARWRHKWLGLILAIAFIMFLNYVRILTLWYVGIYSVFLFDTMHLYVWEFIIIALGAWFWYYWYETFVKTR